MNTIATLQSSFNTLRQTLLSSAEQVKASPDLQKTVGALAESLNDFAAQLQGVLQAPGAAGGSAPVSTGAVGAGAGNAAGEGVAGIPQTVTTPADTAKAPTTVPKLDGKAFLLPVADTGSDSAAVQNAKPNISEFMKATGVDFQTASSTLYGVVGSNTDFRDWSAIMKADNPLAAARAATGAMYASELPYGAANAKPMPQEAIKAQAGHFAWAEVDGKQNLWLLDGNQVPLRQLSLDAPTLLSAARDFGVDTAPLASLGEQLDSLGVRYRPGQLYAHSDHGVDLGALAAGQLGTRYDWTQDGMAASKGDSALQALKANQALAAELGIRRVLS